MSIEERAARARALLSDALLLEAFESIREREMTAFASSALDDTKAHQQARLKLWAVEQVVGEIQAEIDNETLKQ